MGYSMCVYAMTCVCVHLRVCLLTCAYSLQSRELLLYLPGVDGRNMEAVEQFDILSVTFDTWCMTVDGSDRSSFEDLQHQVKNLPGQAMAFPSFS